MSIELAHHYKLYLFLFLFILFIVINIFLTQRLEIFLLNIHQKFFLKLLIFCNPLLYLLFLLKKRTILCRSFFYEQFNLYTQICLIHHFELFIQDYIETCGFYFHLKNRSAFFTLQSLKCLRID